MLTVDQAGIDTWSPAWYVDEGSPAETAMRSLASVRVPRGFALPDPIEGHRVGWFPSSRLLWAEGHPGGDGLGVAEDLPAVLDALHEGLRDHGNPVTSSTTRDVWTGPPRIDGHVRLAGFAGVRRIDATLDLRFDRAADGLAVLAGVAALLGREGQVQRKRGYIETVTMKGHSGRKTLGRWYDKGVESGAAGRGRLIRPEDQRRYPKAARRGVEELSTAYVRGKLHQRFAPLWRASKGVVVSGPMVLAAKLADAVEAGEITAGMAERLAGYALMESVAVATGSRRTGYRRRAQLRDLGLVLADEGLDEVEVDLHAVLERVMDEASWRPRQG